MINAMTNAIRKDDVSVPATPQKVREALNNARPALAAE